MKYVTESIERTTGVRIQIGGVDFRPMESLVLTDVLLCDTQKDTLLFCKDFRMKVDSFSFVTRRFTIKEVALDRADIHLVVYRGEDGGVMNIENFLDSLQGKASPSGVEAGAEKVNGKPAWIVGLEKIKITNSRFTYREDVYEPVEYGVNWTDVGCGNLNVEVSGFDFGEKETVMVVRGLSLVEKSGLQIRELGGRTVFRSGNLVITDCKIELERSIVDLLKMEYCWTPDQHDWRNFVTKMQQYYELGPSVVSFTDLAYFNGMLRGMDNTVKCSGTVFNTVDKIEGKDLHIELGDKSVVQGRFKSFGLPDVRNTVFNIELHDSYLNPDDLQAVYLPWFDMNIPVPSPLRQLQYVDFERIAFDGTLSDFVVKAKSVTPSLCGELKFAYSPCRIDPDECSQMSGDFDFSTVDCGKFAGVGWLGKGNWSGNYSGSLAGGKPSMNVKSRFNSLTINGGQVRDLDLFLTWENARLNVMSALNNDCMHGGVLLSYDMNDSLNFMSAKGSLGVEPEHFGLSFSGKGEAVSCVFDLVYAGNGLKNSFCNLTLSDFNYSGAAGSFTIDTISIEDSRNDRYSTTTLSSDVADFFIDGNYMEIRPMEFVTKLVRNYLPAYVEKGKKIPEKFRMDKVDFQLGVEVKDVNRVLAVLYPELRVSAGTKIQSRFRYGQEPMNLTLVADTLSYQHFFAIHSKVNLTGDTERLRMVYNAEQLAYGGQFQLYNIRDEVSLQNNHVNNKLTWSNWERRTYSGELSTSIFFTPDKKNSYKTEIVMHPGVIMMADSVWQVKPSTIFIDGKTVTVNDFSVGRNGKYLLVKGKISENPEEKLAVALNDIELSEVGQLFFNRRFQLFGTASGNLTVQDYYKDRLLSSDFNIEDWGVNRDTMGSLRLRSYWDADSRSLIIGAENRVGGATPLTIAGYYVPATDTLEVDVKLSQVGLSRLGKYAADYISETSGGLSGAIRLSGTMAHPDVSGFIRLDSVAMKVNSLNTNLLINDRIHLANNRLVLDNFVLRDMAGNTSVCNGDYRFLDDKYNLKVKLDHFLLLNTDFSHNEAFYGKACISGLTEINNLDGQTNVTVNARTENTSRLYIPLTSGMVEQDNNFLHFVNANQPARRRGNVVYKQNNINLNANLEVNDQLEVQVIFDPTVGDVLKTTGQGDIKVALDKDGNLNMFGEYKISKGDYLFTLSNLMNKKFVLTPGGSIRWSGSPYDAALDISAIYNLKTSLHELMADQAVTSENGQDKSADKGKKVPVECILNLSDNLTNPVVKFDINFPTLESQSKSYIQGLFSSQDEINKQMFSLLLLNRFYRTDNDAANNWGEQAGMASVTTVTEMMSSQLSRWLSQISNNFDIGFSYHMGDREITTDEIEVALSTQLLNDRVTLSANGNVGVGGTKNMLPEKGNNTNIAGDFDVDVKLNKQGTLKLKAYSHTDEKIIYNKTETIQGVGVSYQESFDTLKELLHKYWKILKGKRAKS